MEPAPSISSHSRFDPYLGWGLVCSLFAHVAFAVVLTQRTLSPPAPTLFTVDVIPELPRTSPQRPAPSRQIVSTPDLPESTESPKVTRLEAEKDFATPKESIKRGIDRSAGPVVAKSSGQPQPPSPLNAQRSRSAAAEKKPNPAPKQSTESKAPVQKITQLALDRSALLEKFSLPTTKSSSSKRLDLNERTGGEGKEYRAFSRPAGSGAAFLGVAGVPDYLPNLPDGDLTLLNTKANLFAVFVRRVATQVFAQLRANGWESLSAGDINSISDFVRLKAVVSPEGKLLRAELLQSSGSARFDAALKAAAELGARDPNPPKGAVAADGNIHFIFQSRSWVRFGTAPRTGAPVERRWLLLGTGLE